MNKSFKDYLLFKETDSESGNKSVDWKQKYINLKPGFIPPLKMRSIIEAFNESGKIKIMDNLGGKPLTLPSKSLYLVGGAVRDHLMNKTPKDFDLATDATPEQIGVILNNAGFKHAGDDKELKLPFEPKKASSNDKKIWFVKGKDSNKKPFVISAIVDGSEFEIATFRKDPKISDGDIKADFSDNPVDDASKRDLTMNALYILLSSPDGENSKLYDPTGHGYHDVTNKIVRAVGNVEERFKEDKLRVLRTIRMHCRFAGGAKMDSDIEKAIPKFKHLEGVALERVRKEFIDGLLHPDIDSACYLNIYKKFGLLDKVFPGIKIENANKVPLEFKNQKDKPLALAWLLQHNDLESISEMLSPFRRDGLETKQTGWTVEERNAVLFLLKLKQEFNNPEDLPKFMKMREGTGLSSQQIRDWVDMFKIKVNLNGNSFERHARPNWAKVINAFADHGRSTKWEDIISKGGHICPNCKGIGCEKCLGTGEVSPDQRGKLISAAEIEKFKNKLK